VERTRTSVTPKVAGKLDREKGRKQDLGTQIDLVGDFTVASVKAL